MAQSRRGPTLWLGLLALLPAACAPVYVARGGKTEVTRTPTRAPALARPVAALQVVGPGSVKDRVQQVTEADGPFPSFSIDSTSLPVDPAPDLAITLVFRAQPDHGGVGRALYHIFRAALTLGVLPIVKPTDVVLDAVVTGREGEPLGSYHLEGSIVEIQQLVGIFLPIGAFLTPERAGARVIEDLVRRLYRRLEQDGILAPAPAS